jgi:hypothetical protein
MTHVCKLLGELARREEMHAFTAEIMAYNDRKQLLLVGYVFEHIRPFRVMSEY